MDRVVAALCSSGLVSGGSSYSGTTPPQVDPVYPLFPYGAFYGNLAGIYIMKGTKPTSFTGLTTYASGPTANILCSFNAYATFSSQSTADNKFVLSTSNATASASGTATWFWAIGPAEYNPSIIAAASVPLSQQFIGTVGVAGSGADLEMSSTSIVASQAYRITNLTLNVSPTYTV